MNRHSTILTALLLALLPSIGSHAVPAYPKPVEIPQPNGYMLKVQLLGDEYHHWMETEDGYTLLPDEEGFLTLAMPDLLGDLQPSKVRLRNAMDRDFDMKRELTRVAKHAPFSFRQTSEIQARRAKATERRRIITPSTPVIGTRKFLMVMMQFPDRQFKHTQSEFDALMNEIGYTAGGNHGSVRDFYRENSFGQLDLVTDVIGIYTAQHAMAYYGNNTNGDPYSLAREALNAAAKEVNLSDYDADGDGYIDGLHIVFAGYGEEAGGGEDCIWSHEATTSGIFANVGGIKMNAYSCTPELQGSTGNSMSYIGVICHEIGHALGTPDFYDTNYGQGGQFGGTGKWDVMGSGSWNGDGACPAHFNPYTKIYDYKWCEVQDGNRAFCGKLSAKTKGDFLRINTQTEGEYFLLEYRSRKGFDQYIPGHGLMVWRATNGLSARNGNTLNAFHKQQFYPLAANATEALPNSQPSSYGSTDSPSTPFPGTDNVTELTDETTPSMQSWEGTDTEFPLTNIVENTLGEYVEFDICGGDYGTAYNLTATDPKLTSLTLTWNVPQHDMQVMLLCNNEDVFGTPENREYTVGELVADVGQVIYVGSGTEFLHTGLKEHTYYYYRICTWVKDTQSWAVSGTRIGRTKTGIITTFPFMDDYETQTLDKAYEEEVIFGQSQHWVVAHPHPYSTDWALTFNACDGFTHQQSRLLLPLMDFSETEFATLSFDYRNWIISAKVMYRTSPSSHWKELKELRNHYISGAGTDEFLASEEHIDLLLPDLSAEYQVCLLGDFSPRGSSMSSIEIASINNLKIQADTDILSLCGISGVGAGCATVSFDAIVGSTGVIETGIAYSTSSTNKDLWQKVKATPGNSQLTGLDKNTTYYCCAYAKTASGTLYSEQSSFKTLSYSAGSGTEDDPILISSLADWNILRSQVNGGDNCENLYFALTNSLTLSSGNKINQTFSGHLDGRGYTLSYSSSGIVDYFIKTLGAKGELSNLKLTTGALVNYSYGIIHDCEVKFEQDYINTTISNGFGFIATRNYGIIHSCQSYARSFTDDQKWGLNLGGICGWNFKLVSKCSFEGSLGGNNNITIGGIAGINYYGDSENGLITHCINRGNISAVLNDEGRAWCAELGGISGNNYGTIDQCANLGTIFSSCSANQYDTDNYAGGIAGGLQQSRALIKNCYNAGKLSTAYNLNHRTCCAGGIAGYGYLAKIQNCISAEDITSTGKYTNFNHAILGTNNQTEIEHCFYTGTFADNYATALTADEMKASALVSKLNNYNEEAVWKTGSIHPELIMESTDYILNINTPRGITTTSATLSGIILGASYVACGIEWRKAGSSQWHSIRMESGGYFSETLQGLTPATLYEARLFLSTEDENARSSAITFATEFAETGTADNPVLLYDVAALKVFRQTVHQGNQYSNQVVRLMTDIDLRGDKGELWQPITEGSNGGFAGEFDGNGHVIRNMKVVSGAPTAGFFGTTFKCYVHDLTILNGEIISNVAPSQNGYLGGIGGIIGDDISYSTDGRPLVERCSFTGTITGGNRTGGIVGGAPMGNSSCIIKDCYANAALYASDNESSVVRYCGGIVGEGDATNCYFVGTIETSSGTNCGGIVGNSNTAIITNSYMTQRWGYNGKGDVMPESQMKDGTLLAKFSEEVWRADNTETPVNGGFPVLISQSSPHLWIEYSANGEAILAKGIFFGAEKDYATRGFEVCYSPEAEDLYPVFCESANTFSAVLHYTAGQYLRFRAFARENDAFTAYSEWVILDGEVHEATPGDVNIDGFVDIADIQSIINIITGSAVATALADVNDDEEVDVGDIQAVINIIIANLQNSPAISTTMAMTENNAVYEDYVTWISDGTEALVGLHNRHPFSAFQLVVTLPEEAAIQSVSFDDNRLQDFSKVVRRVAAGQYLILGFATDGSSIGGDDGGILQINISGNNAIQPIYIADAIFSTAEAMSHHLPVLDGEATGISYVDSDSREKDIVNVYNLDGTLFRQMPRQAISSQTLPAGCYIVGNKKLIIK